MRVVEWVSTGDKKDQTGKTPILILPEGFIYSTPYTSREVGKVLRQSCMIQGDTLVLGPAFKLTSDVQTEHANFRKDMLYVKAAMNHGTIAQFDEETG